MKIQRDSKLREINKYKIRDNKFLSFLRKLKILKELIFIEEKRREEFLKMKNRHPEVRFLDGAFADNDCIFSGPAILYHDVKLMNCRVGKNTYIARNSRFNNCEIGNYCSIGPEVFAGLGIHPSKIFVSTHPSFYSPENASNVRYVTEQKFIDIKKIRIGSDVWIGARATIIDGVIIGDGAIIGAGALVNRDVEPFSVVGGVPAKEIRKRFSKDEIEILLRIRWWDKEEAWVRSNVSLFLDIHDFTSNLAD